MESIQKSVTDSESVPGSSGHISCSTNAVAEAVPIIECRSEDEKRELTDGLQHCRDLLLAKNVILNSVSHTISQRSKCIGQEIFNRIMDMLNVMEFTEEEELYKPGENIGEEITELEEAENQQTSSQISDEFSSPSTDPEKTPRHDVPFETKVKAVKLAELHPGWSIKTIAHMTTRKLKSKPQLQTWRQQVTSGGNRLDKIRLINSWVLNRFTEARDSLNLVTTKMLQQWAMAAAFQYNMNMMLFSASSGWAKNFKRSYRIRQRRVTKYVSHKDQTSLDELLKSAERFQQQTSSMIPEFDPDFVINTDQTGCEYHISSHRTLTHRREKVTEVAVQQLNKLTHSYTAQYAFSLSGKLLPKVFICLQEVGGKFGPRVQADVDALMQVYNNVFVTATKSGKLTSETYGQFLDNIMTPYVGKEPFLYIIDSWGGQTNPALYDDRFTDENGIPTCTLRVILPKCTPLCQPCDVYFYRQVKTYIRRIQNCHVLTVENRELTTRNDAIKIQSIVHQQLQAPIYEKMLKYAWFAAKLSSEREIFLNVNDVAFPDDLKKHNCDCGALLSFAQCSWCREYLCFKCFYDEYHPQHCEA